MVNQPETDAELIRRRLRETEHIGSKRGRARALGVSEGTVRIWLAAMEAGDPFPPLSDKVRNRLCNTRATQPPPPGVDQGSDLEREWLAQLRRISQADAPESQKMMSVDSLASFVAKVAWARAEAAAVARANAVGMADGAAKARAEASRRPPLETPREGRPSERKRKIS